MMTNRKLLCSVFNAQEAREAVLGGARIIDSEDPKSALGNIKPQHIMSVSDAVLDFKRDFDLQLSTNIGEDQLLFRRAETGEAIEKSPYEIAGKAAQAAIGVSCAMGTRVHPVNLVKVGVDGMTVDKLVEVLTEVVQTLRRTEQFSHCQVMSVLFAQDMVEWKKRKHNDAVRRVLVELREFYPSNQHDPNAFDVSKYATGTLRDFDGNVIFNGPGDPSLGMLIAKGVLPKGADHSFVRVNDLYAHEIFFPNQTQGSKTGQGVIRAMVDATAKAGANAIMLDTSILSKVSNICLVDTSESEMIDMNRYRVRDDKPQKGILNLKDIRFFVEYCHYRGVSANIAGSVESYQAQQLWALVPELDQISTRGSASGVEMDPSSPGGEGADTRQHRVIKRSLVRGLAPPEHGGLLNLPVSFKENREAGADIARLKTVIGDRRKCFGWPDLTTNYVDSRGTIVASEH